VSSSFSRSDRACSIRRRIFTGSGISITSRRLSVIGSFLGRPPGLPDWPGRNGYQILLNIITEPPTGLRVVNF
jgi:hypothetical protein